MNSPSRPMAAFISAVLLLLYCVVLLAPAFRPGITFDATLQESLKTFLTIAVSYYIGTSQSSAKKDDTITALSTTKEVNA